MAKITNEAISAINTPDELTVFLAVNLFEDENAGVLEENDIPEYIKNSMCIIQFETEIEMNGDFQNYYYSGYNCEKFANAFEETGNKELADYIRQYIEFYKLYEAELQNSVFDEFEKKSAPVANEIQRIINEKMFWGNVHKYIQKNRIELLDNPIKV
jgi:hypothetical protein